MITNILPSYLYQQYANDPTSPYLQAFFDAYNTTAQGYLDQLNNLNLPVYTNANITGVLLDWVAQGIYGFPRPSLSAGTAFTHDGVYDTVAYDTTAYTQNVTGTPSPVYTVTDDYFKRILTWNFYKGDGFQYTTTWLKRRVTRFLYGTNGVDFPFDNTYQVSVTYTAPNTVNITIPNLTISPIFKAGIQDGVLYVPFQYQYNITY